MRSPHLLRCEPATQPNPLELELRRLVYGRGLSRAAAGLVIPMVWTFDVILAAMYFSGTAG